LYGLTEGAHTTTGAHAASVGGLSNPLERQLSSNSAGTADKTSQWLSSASKEQKTPYDNQKLGCEKGAEKLQDLAAGEAQISDRETRPSHSSFRLERKSTSGAKGSCLAVLNAADAWGDNVTKTVVDVTRNVDDSPTGFVVLHSGDVLNGSQAGETQQKGPAPMCDMCVSDGTSICKNCFKFVCGKCKEICNTDLCSASKGQHKFKDLRKIAEQRSANLKAISSLRDASVNEGVEDEGKDWPCSRCTYLNPPEHRICAMCAASRGFSYVERSAPGSRVCRNCTFFNEEDVKVCEACFKTLGECDSLV